MDRRRFLVGSAAALVSSQVGLANASDKLRVAVIGHTGRGNFGHGLDTVWMRLPETQIVAVADANTVGLNSAKKRLKTEQGFEDYRVMLNKVAPDIVAVCPRHPDQHRDMIVASIEAGAKGIYVEAVLPNSSRGGRDYR